MGEVSKAHSRRIKEGWFDKYCPADQPGIDIGCQDDMVHNTFRPWDLIYGDGDATFMEEVPDNTYHTVHASHVLEHLEDPVTAIKNWYRIARPGGHVIILVPHRDLYEKKRLLPSNWNFDHKSFWLPESEESPHTKSLKKTILTAIPSADIVVFRVLNDGYLRLPNNVHPVGEYSIEAIIKKI